MGSPEGFHQGCAKAVNEIELKLYAGAPKIKHQDMPRGAKDHFVGVDLGVGSSTIEPGSNLVSFD